MAQADQFGTVYARLDAYGALWLEGPNNAGDYYVWHGPECDFEGVREIVSENNLAPMMEYFDAAERAGGPIYVGRIRIDAERVHDFVIWLRSQLNPTKAALDKTPRSAFSEFVKSGGRY